MSLSYDGGLLGHLAEHMLYLSTTPSFWYSLNSSYDHGFHLSHRLGMPPLDYERLLAAANLAHYHPKWGGPPSARETINLAVLKLGGPTTISPPARHYFFLKQADNRGFTRSR